MPAVSEKQPLLANASARSPSKKGNRVEDVHETEFGNGTFSRDTPQRDGSVVGSNSGSDQR